MFQKTSASSVLLVVARHPAFRLFSTTMNHALQDAVSLELGRRIASGLQAHPEWLEVARENLRRWMERNRDTPSLVRGYREWQELLDRSLEEVCTALTAETDEGQRLRQNSPFAGVFSPQEVWEIKSRHRHGPPTA